MKTIGIYAVPDYKAPAVTAAWVYKTAAGSVTAPQGYEFTGEFRPPKEGETFFSNDLRTSLTWSKHFEHLPRLILKKSDPRYRHIFEPTGENRIPRFGEWFQTAYGLTKADGNNTISYPIYTLYKELIED